MASCGSCYWVLTRQLVRHLLEVIGPWSHIHERIFIFLIESRTYGDSLSNDARYRAEDLAEVRLYGLLQGNPKHTPRVCSGTYWRWMMPLDSSPDSLHER